MLRLAALAPLAAATALGWAASGADAWSAERPVADIRVAYHFNAIGAGIGELTVDIKLAEDSYAVSAQGRTVGLVDMISRLRVSGSSDGAIAEDRPRPSNHTYTYSERGRTRQVTLAYDEGGTPAVNAQPPFTQSFARVPVPQDRIAGTVDPSSPFVIPAAEGAEPLAAAHCGRDFSVFTGELLFEADVTHISSSPSTRVRGTIYEGPVMHCSVAVKPIGGHKEGSYLSKMSEGEAPEVWMAPIIDGRYYLPVKVTVPTPFGMAELVARSISINPAPSRASLGP